MKTCTKIYKLRTKVLKSFKNFLSIIYYEIYLISLLNLRISPKCTQLKKLFKI